MRGVGKRLIDERTFGDALFRCFRFDDANETATDFQSVIGKIRNGFFLAARLNLDRLFRNDVFGSVAQSLQQGIDNERPHTRLFESRITGDVGKIDTGKDVERHGSAWVSRPPFL